MQEMTNFSFKIFKIMGFLRFLKCSKRTVELAFTTQKVNALENLFNCTFFYIQKKIKQKIRKKTALTKCNIWYFLFMSLNIISFTLSLFQHK